MDTNYRNTQLEIQSDYDLKKEGKMNGKNGTSKKGESLTKNIA